MVLCKHPFAYLVQVKNLTLDGFQLCLLVFFNRTSFSEPNENFFMKLELSLKKQRAKSKFSINPNQIILEFYNILVQIQFTTSNTISSIENLVYMLPRELQHSLGLRILENSETLEKSQLYVETKASVHFLFKKSDFGNSNQKSSKNGYQTFIFPCNIAGFMYFVPNILSRIVNNKRSLSC